MRDAAESPAFISRRVVELFALLREEHRFAIGQAETREALRALRLVGLSNPQRVRAALRSVACGNHAQLEIFEAAYDHCFLDADQGTPQAQLAVESNRPPAPPIRPRARTPRGVRIEPDPVASAPGSDGPRQRIAAEERPSLGAWSTLHARVSALAAWGDPPIIETRDLDAMEEAARHLVRSIHLGRSRRWRPQARGPRFDMRRTLRASLQTGGDPAVQHRLGPPPRAPRIVMLLDGSRSMASDAMPLLQLAYALGRATPRLRAFVFSTQLADVSRILQTAQPGHALEMPGEAWGGGTRIGANLARFVRDHAPRLLDRQTLVLIASDGLDSGDTAHLQRAMREVRRRCARVVWLNPHARSSGFAPSAAGMNSARPFVDILDAVTTAADVERLASRLARDAYCHIP